MSKTTATLKDILQSEFINMGLNEFNSRNRIYAFEDEFQFIKKVMKYDDDTHKIVTLKVFGSYEFENEIVDRFIKKIFINRFYDREIAFQTIERFNLEVIRMSMTYEHYINEIVLNISKYIMNESENITKGDSQSKGSSRSLAADLPQNNINMSLENDILNFASTNDISKTLNDTTSNGKTTNQSYDLGNLKQSQNLINDIMNKYDKNCFLQRW